MDSVVPTLAGFATLRHVRERRVQSISHVFSVQYDVRDSLIFVSPTSDSLIVPRVTLSDDWPTIFSSVPEPASLLLVVAGLAGIVGFRRNMYTWIFATALRAVSNRSRLVP
jgi:hypothetical protein